MLSFFVIITSLFLIFSPIKGHTGDAEELVKKSISFKSNSLKKSVSNVEVDLSSLVLTIIANKLENFQPPFNSCLLIKRPRLPTDFGLTAEIKNGWIDKIKAEYLANAGKYNLPVKEVTDPGLLKDFAICLVSYAEVVSKVLQVIGNKTYKDILDLQRHIEYFIEKNSRYSPKKILDKIEKIDFTTCRFAGDISKIQCGELYLEISINPRLLLAKSRIYDPPFFMNVSSVFRTELEKAKNIESLSESLMESIRSKP